MKRRMRNRGEIIGAVILAAGLLWVIWDPALPSSWIIQEMADSIDPKTLSLDRPAVVRFELSGRGGGTYSLVADRDKVEVVEGETEKTDLILYLEARDFNDLILSMAGGEADEQTFRSLIVSKVLTFSGDIAVFQRLFGSQPAAS
ncbi:MAG: SCP2 sterol-binding domain-containing protein [bacterium]